MIRRRRLRLTPGPVRTLPDPQDPSLPQVSPVQPGPATPLPPPEPAPAVPPTPPEPPAAPPELPADPPPGKPKARHAAPLGVPGLDLGPTAVAAPEFAHVEAAPTTPPRPGKVLPAPRPTPGGPPATAPLQLALRRAPLADPFADLRALAETDLPLPKDDRVGRPVPARVWMRTDDDDRLTRRGTRDDLWSLQRSQQRPQPTL